MFNRTNLKVILLLYSLLTEESSSPNGTHVEPVPPPATNGTANVTTITPPVANTTQATTTAKATTAATLTTTPPTTTSSTTPLTTKTTTKATVPTTPELPPEDLDDFDYCIGAGKGPDSWPKVYTKYCSGQMQSPINIPKLTNANVQPKVAEIVWDGYEIKPLRLNITNTGRTIIVTPIWGEKGPPKISGGLLSHKYKFMAMHFHWGVNNEVGSEHSVDGKFYPIEVHLLHIREDLNSLAEAYQSNDGILVLGYFGEINRMSPCPSLANDIMTEVIPDLIQQKSIEIKPVPLTRFIFTYQNGYVTYPGSLTTPNCNEAVIWMIHIKALDVTAELVDKFRMVSKAAKCMTNNFRNVQPLNGRKVIFVPSVKLY